MDCISGFSKFIDIVSKLFSTRGYLKTYLTRLISVSNYESGARMVAFRTFHERIVPWIKILNLYYYELMGKQNDKMVSWVDNPQTISPGQKFTSSDILSEISLHVYYLVCSLSVY
jgi:hypothetical protein